MKILTVLVGQHASGKTWLADAIVARHQSSGLRARAIEWQSSSTPSEKRYLVGQLERSDVIVLECQKAINCADNAVFEEVTKNIGAKLQIMYFDARTEGLFKDFKTRKPLQIERDFFGIKDIKDKTHERGRQLWVEDEVARHDPDAEKVESAYLRLFNVPFASKNALERWDCGDHFWYRMSDFIAVCMAYDGWSIWTIEKLG